MVRVITDSLSDYVASSSLTLKEVMQLIEANCLGSLIIINQDQKVIGVVTDGDIRRALLRGHTLLLPVRDVMNQSFIYLLQGQEEKGVEIFRDKSFIKLIPIINTEGTLVAVLTPMKTEDK